MKNYKLSVQIVPQSRYFTWYFTKVYYINAQLKY